MDPVGMPNWLSGTDPRPAFVRFPAMDGPMDRTDPSSGRPCLARHHSLHVRYPDHSLDLGRGVRDLWPHRLGLIPSAAPQRIVRQPTGHHPGLNPGWVIGLLCSVLPAERDPVWEPEPGPEATCP